MGHYTRRVIQGRRRATTQQQDKLCSFVQKGTGGTLPEPYKITSSRLLVCMFGKCYAACNFIQHDWFGGGSGEAYPWRVAQTSTC